MRVEVFCDLCQRMEGVKAGHAAPARLSRTGSEPVLCEECRAVWRVRYAAQPVCEASRRVFAQRQSVGMVA